MLTNPNTTLFNTIYPNEPLKKAYETGLVVNTYNRPDYLAECLDCLSGSQLDGVIITIVDDGSDDPRTLDLIETFEIPGVPIIKMYRTEHTGFMLHENIRIGWDFLIEVFSPKYLCTLDDDAVVKPEWMERTRSLYQRERRKRGPLIVTGFNAHTHPVLKEERDFYIKETIGGIHTFLDVDLYREIIRDNIKLDVKNNVGWDWHVVWALQEANYPILCTKPSTVQHIGDVGVHSGGEGGHDVALDFVSPYSILALCAQTKGHAEFYRQLSQNAKYFKAWKNFPDLAEEHGLGPLVYTHLKAVNIQPPEDTHHTLQGLYIRHRRANATRTQTLREILMAYNHAGIESLILKGAALAHFVYPQPGLRPMRDIDLLVRKTDANKAQKILTDLGYDIPEGRIPDDHHHLPIARKQIDGMMVSVEVHHNIFPKTRHYQQMDFEHLRPDAIEFWVDDTPALSLGLEDLLWHIYRHAYGPPTLANRPKLIHLADIIAIVARFADQIDWDKLKRQYPKVVNILPLLHEITPFPAEVIQKLPVDVSHPTGSAGIGFDGWPLAPRDNRQLREFLQETLIPSEWWLRLYYGVGERGSYLWHRWVRHPFHIFEWIVHYWAEGFRHSKNR